MAAKQKSLIVGRLGKGPMVESFHYDLVPLLDKGRTAELWKYAKVTLLDKVQTDVWSQSRPGAQVVKVLMEGLSRYRKAIHPAKGLMAAFLLSLRGFQLYNNPMVA